MEEINNHYVAEDGKVFRRKADGELFGKEIYLGICHYLNGVKCEPFEEKIEDYEQIDKLDNESNQ